MSNFESFNPAEIEEDDEIIEDKKEIEPETEKFGNVVLSKLFAELGEYPKTIDEEAISGDYEDDDIFELINEGGITFDIVRNIEYKGEPFTSVSLFPERSELIEGDVNVLEILKYVRANSDLLTKKNNALGGWYDTEDKKLWLDIVTLVKDQEKAIELGKEFNQKAVFDLEEFEEIQTGGTGEVFKNMPSIEERLALIENIND